MTEIFLVALGGALGAVSRYGLGMLFGIDERGFAPGTLIVNVLGCFLIGVFWGTGFLPTESGNLPANRIKLLFCSGFLGAFTTMSAFSQESLAIANKGYRGLMILHVFGTIGSCLLAVQAGKMAGEWFNGPDNPISPE